MNFRRKYLFPVGTMIMCIININAVTGTEDKVCYQTDGTPACHRHQLGCVRNEIAILSAGYAYTTDCTCVERKCTTCRSADRNVPLVPTATCSSDFYPDDYWRVITTCSKRTFCFVPVSRHRYYNECSSQTAFSFVWYRCVDATYEADMCGGDEQVGPCLSLFYEPSRTTNASQCVCTVSGTDPQSTDTYNITALDIRIGNAGGQANSWITLKSEDDEPTIVTEIRPNTLLLRPQLSSTTKVMLHFKSNHTPERIWILVEGQANSEIRVKCQAMNLPVTNQEEYKGAAHKVSEMASAIIGGTVGSLVSLVVLVLIFLVVCFCRKRRTTAQTAISTKYHGNEGSKQTSTEHDYFTLEVRQEQNAQNKTANECDSSEPQYADIDIVQCKGSTGEEYDDVCSHTSKDQKEDNYNCLVTSNSGDRVVEVHYDTTASASQIVKELDSQESEYSYDHLGASVRQEVTDNHYDTTCPNI